MPRSKSIRLAATWIRSSFAVSLILCLWVWRVFLPYYSHRDYEVRQTSAFTAPAEAEAVNMSVLGLHGVKLMRFCNVSDGVFMPPMVCGLLVVQHQQCCRNISSYVHPSGLRRQLENWHFPSHPPSRAIPATRHITAPQPHSSVGSHVRTGIVGHLSACVCALFSHCHCGLHHLFDTRAVNPLCRAAQVQRSFDRTCTIRRQCL